MIGPVGNHLPALGHDVFVAANATVLGRVRLGAETSVWYGAVLRGDVGQITVGERTNIQDLTVIHVSSGTADTHVGTGVTIGHRAVLHGCTIGDDVLVGIGAIVLDGAVVGSGAVIGAGTVIPPGRKIPPGTLVLGAPARVLRAITEEERRRIERSATRYVALAREHAALAGPRPPTVGA